MVYTINSMMFDEVASNCQKRGRRNGLLSHSAGVGERISRKWRCYWAESGRISRGSSNGPTPSIRIKGELRTEIYRNLIAFETLAPSEIIPNAGRNC